MLFNKESPSNAGLPLVVNTPGWVKGALRYCFYLYVSIELLLVHILECFCCPLPFT